MCDVVAVGENGIRASRTGEGVAQLAGDVVDAGGGVGGGPGASPADVRPLCSRHELFCRCRHSFRKLIKHHRPFSDSWGTMKLNAACIASRKEPRQFSRLYCMGVMRDRQANPNSTMTAPE